MAKKRSRRFNLRRVRIQSKLAIGALAAEALVAGVITNAAAQRMRFVSLKASYAISDLGAAADDGFSFGLAHSDYSAAEIEECLESYLAIDLSDKVGQEKANRLVREIGTISLTGIGGVGGGISFNDGKQVKTKLNWLMAPDDQLQIWVRNSSGTVYTTGSQIVINGNLWVKD